MAGFALRLSDELHSKLRAAAEQDDRSLNAEAVTAIEDYLTRRRVARMVEEARSMDDLERDILDDFDATCEALRGA